MLTENMLLNLGFEQQTRSSYQPGWQSHGDVYIKNGLAIDGYMGVAGSTAATVQWYFTDLSGQTRFTSLKQLDNYFIAMGKESIFKL